MCGVQAAYTLYLLWSRPYIVPSSNVLAPAIAAATTAGFALAAVGQTNAGEALALAALILTYTLSLKAIGSFAFTSIGRALALWRPVVSGRPYHQDDRGHDGGVVFFSPQPYARDFRCLPEVSVEVLPRVELHVARSSGHGVHIVSDEDIDAPTAATAKVLQLAYGVAAGRARRRGARAGGHVHRRCQPVPPRRCAGARRAGGFATVTFTIISFFSSRGTQPQQAKNFFLQDVASFAAAV
jgi:hypothetical protein